MTTPRYHEISDLFESRIRDGVYRVGDRLPSVREASRSLGVSLTTVYNAYNRLELKGLIRAKPQSGYAVIPRGPVTNRNGRSKADIFEPPPVDIETIALKILAADNLKSATPFGSVFVDAELFPVSRLLKLMRDASRKFEDTNFRLHSVSGLDELRREIAKRYTRQGYSVSADEVIVTSGSIEAINIALSALLKPGDTIAIEDPCFYPTIFSARRLDLRTIPIPVSPRDGLDLDYLENVLSRAPVKAVVMMTSCHLPMGVNLAADKQQRLVRLAEKYDIPLIENGAYSELMDPATGSASCKLYETRGSVINCSSFSSSLSPQLRVGWITAGRFRDRILSVKFLTSMTSHWIAQRTALEFLKHENLDRHMRNLRQVLEQRMAVGLRALDDWPDVVKQRSSPKGGSMVWVQLPDRIDTMQLFAKAADRGISFMPGALFSAGHLRRNELAMNFSFPWTEEALRSLRTLLSMVDEA